MTISSETRKAGPFVGNGVATAFPFAFKVFTSADVSVTLLTVADGTQQTLVLDTDYTVSLNADQNANPGGSVTYNPSGVPMASTHTLTIGSTVARTQGTHLVNGGAYLADNIENMADRVTIITQQEAEKVTRSLKLPIVDSDPPDDIPAAAQRANSGLGFDALGRVITYVLQTGTSLVSLATSAGASLIGFIQAGTGAVLRTVQDKARDFVNAADFGASPTATAAVNAAAIQAALNTTKNVRLSEGEFSFSTGLKFKKDGQILRGSGTGDNGNTGTTILKYTGAGGAAMISWYDGASHYSNAALRDIALNGNALANRGAELYNDALAGGCWRQQLSRVSIYGVTQGANPTNVYAGAGTGVDNSNDFELHSVSMFGGAYGIQTGGAMGSLTGRCTVQGATAAGVNVSIGGAIALGDTTFSANEWDVLATNTQMVSAIGAWFEDSKKGIYKVINDGVHPPAHTLFMAGCVLHTASTIPNLMDMNNAAGYFDLHGCVVDVTTASTLVKNVNGTSEYSIMGTNCSIAPGYRHRVQGYQRSDQGAFAAGVTGDQANVTGDGTIYSLNAVGFTEEYDSDSIFAAATGIFTAGLYGYYNFTGQIELGNIGAAHTEGKLWLNANGQRYLLEQLSPAACREVGGALLLSGSRTVFLSPTNTAYLEVEVSNSTKTVSVLSGGAGTDWRTRFEGRMI